MTPGHSALRLLTAIAPLLLTPALAAAINAGRLNFGGGEKDIVLLVPWLLWSLVFAGVALACWRRRLRLGPSLLRAGLCATAVVILSGLVFTVLAPRFLGVSKGG